MEWLAGTEADVVCLQEVRAEPHQLPEEVRQPDGWHVVHAPAAAKGRAGVSLYTRREPDRVRVGFGSAEFDGSGRYVEAELPGVTVASLYLPSGEVGTERQDEKMRFMGEFLAHLEGAARAGRRRRARGPGLRRLEHRPPAGRPQELAWQHQELRLPAGGAGLARPGLRRRRGRVRRRRPRPAPGRRGAVHLVVVPRAGLRQRLGLAHRLPRRHARAGRQGGQGPGRARRHARRAVVGPRAGDRRLRPLGPPQSLFVQPAVQRQREFRLHHTAGQRAQPPQVVLGGRGAGSRRRTGRRAPRRARGRGPRRTAPRRAGCPRGPGRRRRPAGAG